MSSIFTLDFAKATGERAIRAGAASVVSVWAVGDGILNAWNVNWSDAGGIFLGSAAVSLLLSLGGNVATGDGPAFTKAETVRKTKKTR